MSNTDRPCICIAGPVIVAHDCCHELWATSRWKWSEVAIAAASADDTLDTSTKSHRHLPRALTHLLITLLVDSSPQHAQPQ